MLQQIFGFDVVRHTIRCTFPSFPAQDSPNDPSFMPNSEVNASLYGNPALSQFKAWLAAFNSHDRAVLVAYHEAYFPFAVANRDIGNIDREVMLSNVSGGFDIIEVLSASSKESKLQHSDPNDTAKVILRERNRPIFARAMMQVDMHNDSYPVTKFEIHPTNTPIEYVPDDRKEEYRRALAPLTSARRQCIVKAISDVVREIYVLPKSGENIIHYIQKMLEGGKYDNFEDSENFAQQLVEDMQAASGDLHLGVLFREPPPPRNDDAGDDDDQDERKPEKLFDIFRGINFAFGTPSVEDVHGKKLGFLPIFGFVPSTPDVASDFAAIRKAIGDMVSEVASTDALIIDLRRNGGGAPETVALVLSYLLDDGPIQLNDLVDRNGTVKETFSTLPPGSLPEGTTRFNVTKPLFVLTSKETISAGEEMAYDLQALKRAKSIIGEDEATAGAANPVTDPRFICEEEFGKHWWVVAVPSMRPVNRVTGTNWEGVGVKSDVVVGQDDGDAKDVAREMALEALGVKVQWQDQGEVVQDL